MCLTHTQDGCAKLNGTLASMRDAFAHTPMNLAQVLGGVKADLMEFAASLVAGGTPNLSLKLLTSLPLFMQGKCPITGIGLANADGSDFDLAAWANAKLTEKMRTIYNVRESSHAHRVGPPRPATLPKARPI